MPVHSCGRARGCAGCTHELAWMHELAWIHAPCTSACVHVPDRGPACALRGSAASGLTPRAPQEPRGASATE